MSGKMLQKRSVAWTFPALVSLTLLSGCGFFNGDSEPALEDLSAQQRVCRGDGTFRSGTLPAIELTDVGGKKGKSPAGLGAVVVLAMAGEMLKQAVAHKLAEGFRFEAEKLLSTHFGISLHF